MTPARRSLAALVLGGGLGVAADLSRVWISERLGTAVWLGLFLAALHVLLADDDEGVSLPLAAAALGIGALVWRDSPALHALNLAVILGCIIAGSRIGAALADGAGGLVAWGVALLETAAHTALGAAAAVSEAAWSGVPVGRGLRKVSGAALGVAFAAPVLAIFSALFAEADPLFASGLERAFSFDFGLEAVLPHAAVIGAVAWLSAGLLRGASMERRSWDVPAVPFAGSVQFMTVGTALGGIAALFLVFVLLQTRYLFGGSSLLGEAGTFTYATYARRGFFELVSVTALTLPVLLVADWALDQREGQVRVRFRGLALLLLGLLGVIVLSALSRMALYAGMYGLTELRVYVTAFMLLLCTVFAWFTLTVLRGNRPAFLRGSFVAAACAVGGMNLLDPDALIARVNLERGSPRVPVDVSYLASLSADAVPDLLERAGRLGQGPRCALLAELEDRWLDDAAAWSISRIEARRALGAYRFGPGRDCPIEL